MLKTLLRFETIAWLGQAFHEIEFSILNIKDIFKVIYEL